MRTKDFLTRTIGLAFVFLFLATLSFPLNATASESDIDSVTQPINDTFDNPCSWGGSDLKKYRPPTYFIYYEVFNDFANSNQTVWVRFQHKTNNLTLTTGWKLAGSKQFTISSAKNQKREYQSEIKPSKESVGNGCVVEVEATVIITDTLQGTSPYTVPKFYKYYKIPVYPSTSNPTHVTECLLMIFYTPKPAMRHASTVSDFSCKYEQGKFFR